MNQVKEWLESVGLALSLVKQAKDMMPDGPERQAATVAIESAEKQAKIAEAAIAQALGLKLCKCSFPPTPMLTVGYGLGAHTVKQIFECPRCGIDTAQPFAYTRTVDATGKKPESR